MKPSTIKLHDLPNAVGNLVVLLARFGAAVHADSTGRLRVDRETRRLHDLDMDDANIVVKLGAAWKLDDLPEGRCLGVAALRRRVGTNPAARDIPLVLAGGIDLRDDREIRLEKRVPIVKPFHLAHAAADALQLGDFVLVGVYAHDLDALAFEGERLAR